MAKITKIIVLDVNSNDLNTQQWQWSGVCICGQEVADIELNEVHKILINIAVTVCTTCMAEARD